MKNEKIKIGLVANNIDILIENFMVSSKVEFYYLDFSWKGKKFPNPHQLESISEADYIVVDTGIAIFLKREVLENDIQKIFSKIRTKSKNGLTGVEGADWFHLAQHPILYKELDVILKSGGVYKDRTQYNSYSGSCSTNRLWNKKNIVNPWQYDNEILDKINVSIPCFIAITPFFRRELRKSSPLVSNTSRFIRNLQERVLHYYINKKNKSSKNYKYHFRGSITHLSRLELGELLNAIDAEGTYKLLFTSDEYMWGSKYERQKLSTSYKEELLDRAKSVNIKGERISKWKLLNEMLSHGVILSPNGFGEICYRHAEAWELNRVLLCQDLSHVEMLFSIEHNKNAVFCKSDFSDIEKRLLDLKDSNYRNSIALNGQKEWKKWIANPNKILYDGFEKYLSNDY